MPAQVTEVDRGVLGEKLGIQPGDVLISINQHSINDQLDLAYWGGDFQGEVVWERDSELFRVNLKDYTPQRYGIKLEPIKIRHCNNKCVFCFIDQNPPDLRKSLYVKDDDYRLSFLEGAYITGTNLTGRELSRILQMNLSPLYISVHSIDEEVRMKLMGRKNKPVFPVRVLLEKLVKNKIEVHTQIVVVPGYNHGDVLSYTLDALIDLGVSSISLVPVGLTGSRENLLRLNPVSKFQAKSIINLADQKRRNLLCKNPAGLIYPTDNMFLTAEMPIPPAEYYDDFPQLENGVGGIRLFLDDINRIVPRVLNRKLLLVTGVSMTPLVKAMVKKIFINPELAEVVTVNNTLYGPMVGTAGLLTGKDILSQLKPKQGKVVFIPQRSLNYQQVTIDGYNIDQLSAISNKKLYLAPQTPAQLTEELIEIQGLIDG
ncbi:MAG: DUF512 domain-containing protein [bacterium]